MARKQDNIRLIIMGVLGIAFIQTHLPIFRNLDSFFWIYRMPQFLPVLFAVVAFACVVWKKKSLAIIFSIIAFIATIVALIYNFITMSLFFQTIFVRGLFPRAHQFRSVISFIFGSVFSILLILFVFNKLSRTAKLFQIFAWAVALASIVVAVLVVTEQNIPNGNLYYNIVSSAVPFFVYAVGFGLENNLFPVKVKVASAQVQPPSSAIDNIDALGTLANLHKEGIITAEEFAEKKAELLAKM